MPMALISCGSDNDEPNEPDKRSYLIVGKWKLTEVWEVWTGLGYRFESHWEKVYGDLVLSINSNGTCSVSGSCVTKNITSLDIVLELPVWFPNINKWEWNEDKRQTTPLKLYFSNGTSSDYKVLFENDNKLEFWDFRFERFN